MNLTKTAYGTWSGGRFMHYGEQLSEEHYKQLMRLSFEKGVRTFVTADVYGVGRADALLGEALKGIPRDEYCLVGIIGHDFYDGLRNGSRGYPRFTDPALRGPEGYAEYLKRATEKSLERCQTSKFDLLMLHNPDSIAYTSEKVWNEFTALKEAGLTDRLGIAPGPANGFTLDMIDCFEKFGDRMDWAMIILNPFEPWPGQHVLGAAEKNGVDILARVVDYGGIFHDDVKPGHAFRDGDHRTHRPGGWIEHGVERLEKIRPIAEKHGLTMLQLACQWTLRAVVAAPAETRTLLQTVPLVLARSHSLKDRLIDLGCPPEKIRLNRTGIPMDAFPIATGRTFPADGQWRFIQACRLIEKKGLALSLTAFAQFCKTYPDSHFTIAGEGPLLPDLEKLAAELGVAEKITFTGFLDTASLCQLYHQSHGFLHPSQTPPDQNQEGIPNSMLEAMATGKGPGRVLVTLGYAGCDVLPAFKAWCVHYTDDAQRQAPVEPPTRLVHFVDALVADVAIAVGQSICVRGGRKAWTGAVEIGRLAFFEVLQSNEYDAAVRTRAESVDAQARESDGVLHTGLFHRDIGHAAHHRIGAIK